MNVCIFDEGFVGKIDDGQHVVAAARELTELVFYGLRDHRIRCLATPAAA